MPLPLSMASVDLVARLVDVNVFRGLCNLNAIELSTALSQGKLRETRPIEISNLTRAFDIDAEAEFLDWFDDQPVDWGDAGFLSDLSSASIRRSDAAEGLRLLTDLASPGSFRCWEGRMLLYLDVLLDREVKDLDDLYADHTWLDALSAIQHTDREGYCESVVMRWMDTREELGVTMDSNADARILPTMEAHQSASDRFHRTLQTAQVSELKLLVGRDWTDATTWGQGEWNLGRLLRDGLPEA